MRNRNGLAAVHVAVCFFLITSAGRAAATARLADDRLPLIIRVEPFDKVVDQHWPRTFGIII